MHCATENITAISTHSGTHLDSPYHYGPECEGQPLENNRPRSPRMVRERWSRSGLSTTPSAVTTSTLEETQQKVEALEKKGYSLKPMDIVLIRTDHTTKYLYTPDYEQTHPGMSVDATEWLVDQGIKVMGIDAWGFDIPVSKMTELRRQGNTKDFFGSHFLGRKKEYIHAEKIHESRQNPRIRFHRLDAPHQDRARERSLVPGGGHHR